MRIEGSMDAFQIPIRRENSGDAVNSLDRAKVDSLLAESGQKVEGEHKELSKEEIFQKVEEVNQKLRGFDRRLEFSIHDETHRIMVKVINTVDDSVIREIPSEKALDMLAYVWKMTGILVDEKR